MVLSIALAACSDGDGDSAAPETTAAEGTTAVEATSTTVDQESVVLAGYRSAWEAQGLALRNASGDVPPELLATTTGAALENLLDQRSQLAEQGEYIDGRWNSRRPSSR